MERILKFTSGNIHFSVEKNDYLFNIKHTYSIGYNNVIRQNKSTL